MRVGGWGEAWGGGPWRAGKGGDGGHQRAVWEQQKVHWFPFLGSLKHLTTGLIWLVTRVGGWGEAHGGRARGEMGGGAPESREQQKVHWFPLLGSNNWSDLAGDEGGGMGGGVGRWPMEGGQGGRSESSVGATGSQKPNNWSDLAGDDGGDGGRARGENQRAVWEMGGGTREQCGSNKRCTGFFF